MNFKVAIRGFRFDANSSFMRGAADAPPLIRDALASEASNRWSENGINLDGGECLFDAGDVFPKARIDEFGLIDASITSLLAQGFYPLSLGGDHSITYPIVTAFARIYPKLSILHFDAHPDLYDEFQGNRHSHASPFARIMEEGLASRLVQVGIRTVNSHQREQAAKFGVEVIEMKHWEQCAGLSFDTPLYISFDIDGLDPAYAPGVSHREPGGFSTRQALDVMQAIRAPIVGADIVEFNPRMDIQNLTATVCAKLVKEIAAQMLANARE